MEEMGRELLHCCIPSCSGKSGFHLNDCVDFLNLNTSLAEIHCARGHSVDSICSEELRVVFMVLPTLILS